MSNNTPQEAKIKARLDQIKAEIDKYEAKAREAKADGEIQMQDEMQTLKEKRSDLEDHLAQLRRSGDAAAKDISNGADRIWAEAEKTMDAVRSRF